MASIHNSFPGFVGSHGPEVSRRPRCSLLQRLKPKQHPSRSHGSPSPERNDSVWNTPPKDQTSSVSSSSSPLVGAYKTITDAEIAEEFDALHNAITAHIKKFYLSRDVRKMCKETSRAVIEQATVGLSAPWYQIQELLDDEHLRADALALCISWTILSRSLLLKLGMANSPGSIFLPPEIVECFQSFSIMVKGKGDLITENEDMHRNFALLSRWKQLTATLTHSLYVRDAFSHFDPRTFNVERALGDLDPLLRRYTSLATDPTRDYARLVDLREVLRRGARFAFMLFAQPCFWKFDWTADVTSPASDNAGVRRSSALSQTLELDMAIWPSLVRVMDGEGRKVEGDVIGRKKYVGDPL